VPDLLPLFPLNTVLFPGLPLPLHIFEERYRQLVREFLDGPAPRCFGVVAIRQGLEAGDDDPVLHEVGCVAELRRVEPYRDGRFDVVVYGGPRFRLRAVDDANPYLRGTVSYLTDPPGEDIGEAAAAVRRAFPTYWDVMLEATGETAEQPYLPDDDPGLLSWIVAGALHVDLPEKQGLLAVPDTAGRLRAEHELLRREIALLRHRGRSVTHGPFSLN
jgi:hypothetical protein